MRREVVIKELEASEYDNLEEPVVVKRKNKSNLFIIDEAYLDKLRNLEVIGHLLKSEEDKEKGKVINADKVFKELRAEYGY
ncbi:MAG: hypothetical protein FWC68_01735 [Oscillospiraceae bacterium]|nr:hypothetical protein [Oscillospiraceae bacterium]